jgi:hypothetical protein
MKTRWLAIGVAIMAVCGAQSRAATYYVAPAGSGLADGSDWANAYGVSQIQTAISACSSPGDEIRLRYGVYSNSAELSAISRPGLTIRGGYLGSGEDAASDPTVLTRALNVTNRILYGQSSTLTFERLSITNGMTVMLTNDSFGAGLYLSNCVTLVTNCLFEGNRLPIPYRNPANTRAHKGGGICAITGSLTVVSSRFRDNSPNYVYAFNNTGSQFGNGVYAQSANVTLSDTIFEYQATGARDGIYGGGVYLYAGSAIVTRCTFNTNTIYNGWTGNGAALYAENVRPIAISNCVFRGNTITGPSMSYGQGGALYIASCYPFLVSNCVFESQAVRSVGGVSRGSTLWLAGAGLSGTIADCTIAESANLIGAVFVGLERVYLDIPSTNRVNIRNVTIQGSPAGGGIYKAGTGILTMTNCLVAFTGGAGLEAAGGTTLVSQCTFADNYGWGVSNAAAPVKMSDSVLWGNTAGGVKSTNVAATYTSSQEPLAGAGNLVTNPVFVAGYYLSVNGLPAQTADSPCIDVGSMTAAAAGMDGRTTRTDGAGDAGQVDLGYHPVTGFAGSFSNLNLYVNVVTGSDANDGWTAGSPLKTITAALGRTIDGSTIYVATGRYYKASGEVFPLTSRTPNLKIIGANRDTTILDATFTNRVFTGDGRGRVWLEGMTFTNGNDGVGAGLYLPTSFTVITNCAIIGNRPPLAYGCGIFAQGGSLDLLDCAVKNNGNPTAGSVRYGGGLYASQVALVLRQVMFDSNFLKAGDNTMYGGALALFGGSAKFYDCTFNTNFLYNGYYLLGGAVYASGVSPMTFSNCVFRGNYLNSTYYYGRGGALYIASCPTLTVANCSFSGSGVTCGNAGLSEGNDIYLTGASGGTISDCSIVAPASAAVNEGFYIETPSPNALAIRNLSMRGGGGAGIRKKGTSSLSMTNVLVSFYGSHGLQAEAGTVSVAHASFGDNVGWGLTNGAATLTVSDSIAWGNGAGGMSPGAGAVSYSCSQEILPGTANMTANPAWIAGYYLSVAGLPVQTVDSPCRDTGSKTAAAAGLDSLTTRTDGGVDVGTVDLGYHYGAGSSMVLSNLMLYVNVVTGNDANDGWTAGSPLKTITAALAKAVDGTAVYVATGRYYRASGEVFPLTSQAPNLSLKGENRDTTILDATLTNRVFSADGRGKIWLEGLTFVNGSVTSSPAVGGAIYLPSCVTVITNCTIVSNRITVADFYGAGIYVLGGSLLITDSRLLNNGYTQNGGARYGGGLYSSGASLWFRNSLVAQNFLGVNAPASGAGLYLSGGSALIDGCTFNTNYTSGGHQHAGAAIYATGVSPLTVTNSMFRGNYLYSSHYFAKGAALYASACSPLKVMSCVFTGNTATVVNFGGMHLDGLEGPLIWAGGLSGSLAGCDIWGQTYSVLINGAVTSSVATNGLLFVDVPLSNSLVIANTFMRGGGGIGIRKRGFGLLAMTNTLVHSFTNHGVQVDAGSVVLANSTFANNGGWGVSNALGAVTGKNSIAWGNAKGGFTNAVLTYTCSQEAQPGTGNKNQDPLFAGAAAKDFRLVRTSPCVNAGLNESWMGTAVDLGGNARIIGKIVDMGAFENTTPPVNGTVIMVR